MLASRPVLRASIPRAARAARAPRNTNVRFQSTTSSSSSAMSPAVAGLAGGVAASAVMYGIWYMTPSGRISRKVNKATYDAHSYYTEATKKFNESTPNADDAVDYVKNFANSYVAWIPGGKKYVDTAFKDLDTLRESHGEEVNKLVNDTYKELQGVAKSGGFSMETASKAMEILGNFSKEIGSLAADSFQDILANHPDIKEKVGPNLDQLKEYGEQYGPEAKKQVDETWKQLREVLAGGLSATTLYKARNLIQEKVEQVKKMGDEAWQKGMEQAKPLLEKNSKVKELIEKNVDALKSGNAKEVFDKVKSAVESGKTDELESYVKDAAEKVKSKGSGLSGLSLGPLDQYAKMIPGGSDIIPKLSQLSEIAQKHRSEGEALLKETMEEIQKIVTKQSKKAQDLVEQASKEAK